MLRTLYNWTLQKATTPAAEVWLAIVAFIESSVFLIPADVLFVPMAIARPARAYHFALIATVASTLGGIAGYFLGYYAYEGLARPVLDFYGKLDAFEQLRSSASKDAILLMLVTSGLAHLPPIKIVTILSGAAGINLWLFIGSCIVARCSLRVLMTVIIEDGRVGRRTGPRLDSRRPHSAAVAPRSIRQLAAGLHQERR